MQKLLEIDFTKYRETLFSGRKNGERARSSFNIKPSETIEIKARQDQLITSSYFLGLLSPELIFLVNEENGDVNQLLNRLVMGSLNVKSQEECVRAIKRSVTAPRSLLGM